jgi:hypothetical protein
MPNIGIFDTFDKENYRESCGIVAFRNMLNPAETNFLRSVLKTIDIDDKGLRKIASEMKICFWVHVMDGEVPYKPYIVGGKQSKHNIIVWNNHIIFGGDYQETVRLKRRLRGLELRPFSLEQYRIAIQTLMEPKPICALRYERDLCCRAFQEPKQNKKPTPISDFFGTVLCRTPDKETFWEEFVKTHEGILYYRSFADWAYAKFCQSCPVWMSFPVLFELRGYLSDFFCQCLQKPLLGSPYEFPLHIKADIAECDKTGCYADAMLRFGGVATGCPCMISSNNWRAIERGPQYYCVKVIVNEFRTLHASDPFPCLSKGVQFWDRIWLEFVKQNYEVDFAVVEGYYFQNPFPHPIEKFVKQWWEEKQQASSPEIAKIIKRSLTVIWGRAVVRTKPVSELTLPNARAQKYILSKQDMIYSYQKLSQGMTKVRVLRSIVAPWRLPQLSVKILSYAKAEMLKVVYEVVDAGFKVYHANTDSIVIDREAMKFVRIGEALGEFKIEAIGDEFICLGAKTRCILKEGKMVKRVWGQKEVEWWVSKV